MGYGQMMNDIMAIARHKKYNVELTYFVETDDYLLCVYENTPMISPRFEFCDENYDIVMQEVYGMLMAEMVQ